MKGIESKSPPAQGGQGRTGSTGSWVGRCARLVLYLLDLLPWMRDVHPWPCMVHGMVLVVCRLFSSWTRLTRNTIILISREGKEHV